MKLTRRTAITSSAALMALGLAACGGSEGSGSGSGGDKKLTIGYLPAWTDGLSLAYLMDNRLTAMGFEVEHEEFTDAGVLYAGLAGADYQVMASGWPEVTHAANMKKFGDDITDLGAYYPSAKLTVAVPEYTDITSIEDLVGAGDRFGGKIYGIEPGAGLTAAVKDNVIPQYGLDEEYELITSSTPAMLTELQKATDAEEDIVVTLWRPFWANEAFPVKDLEDPMGALGESEALHNLGSKTFKEDFPEAAEYIGGIKLDDEQYGSLEDMVVNEYGEGKEAEAIEAWLEANPDVLPPLPES